jgi:hypothetical protein
MLSAATATVYVWLEGADVLALAVSRCGTRSSSFHDFPRLPVVYWLSAQIRVAGSAEPAGSLHPSSVKLTLSGSPADARTLTVGEPLGTAAAGNTRASDKSSELAIATNL